MNYATGDIVVHPQHGVARVEGTVSRGKDQTYVELRIEDKSMTVMIPVEALDEVGIRRLPTREEVDAILQMLGEDADVSAVWAERNAETRERLRSTELLQASMVIRDLTRHRERSAKPLSANESGSLQACMDTVASQVALTLGISVEEATELILSKVEPMDVDEADDSVRS
ncbi:MAG TPA: CarD family transcriptional regulator [Egibacteraceae bacterium]|nr:CarD family transcriptional regulator [Egibacteraceae bacterium]